MGPLLSQGVSRSPAVVEVYQQPVLSRQFEQFELMGLTRNFPFACHTSFPHHQGNSGPLRPAIGLPE
jgi:hypothetical protein